MNDPRQSGPDAPEVGSLADETAKLVGALSDWAREQGADLGAGLGDLAGHATDSLREVNEHLATGGAECRYCPICRLIQAFRETSPEVRQHLAVAGASLLQAGATMLATAAVPAEDGAGSRGSVEHIDLDEDWDPEDDA